MAASLTVTPASGAPAPVNPSNEAKQTAQSDSLPNPQADSQAALKKEAIARIVSGAATPILRNGSEVVEVSRGRWVELKRKADKVDPIFTILAEFSDTPHPVVGGAPGPQHNEIAAPDRTMDNSTYWLPDFNQAHYNQMVNGPGESMADFYYKQSGGKYSVKGDASDWVTLPYSGARYGSNVYSQSSTYWPFVRDSANAWYNSQIAAGKTPAEIGQYLKQFDVWDRYDYDGDGDFNEPDGYIDHFQAIHSGEGEEAGGGVLGADAIWSHRWSAYQNLVGSAGPGEGDTENLNGGTQIGNSGIWIYDYTTEPENGGLGVFTHEYGHDLGLPDLYDTNGGDNSTAYWTLMSGGSWMSHSNTEIGTSPIYMGPWEKLFLGWLDYKTVADKTTKNVSLGSAATPQGLPQAVLVPLPDQTVTTDYNTAYSGSYEWWGGSADDLKTTLVRSLDLSGATTATITAKAQYDTEPEYDFLYAEVSVAGGRWKQVGEPIDGSTAGKWVDLSFDLSPYVGLADVKFRFRYATDGAYHEAGPFLDDIALVSDGPAAFFDNVEAGASPWVASGFNRINGSYTQVLPRFYLAEYRTYTGYDKSFKTGPYNFIGSPKPDWVEKFPYQDGLLVWYVNYAYSDNNTNAAEHPGGGLALPVDARPVPLAYSDGAILGNRRQPFDATFGLQKTDAVTFHSNGRTLVVPSKPGISTFTDADPNKYWSAANPMGSVQVAGQGTTIQVLLELNGLMMVVKVVN